LIGLFFLSLLFIMHMISKNILLISATTTVIAIAIITPFGV